MGSAEYEDFIYDVCRALGEASGVTIHRNATFTGRISGRKIKPDVSFEAQLLGARIVGLVECKRYKQRVEVSDVEEFHSKLDDIGAHKGVMFTTVGYEAGAVKTARGRGIALFVLREGQQPDEIRVQTRGVISTREGGVLRGNFRPWGRFSGPMTMLDFELSLLANCFTSGRSVWWTCWRRAVFSRGHLASQQVPMESLSADLCAASSRFRQARRGACTAPPVVWSPGTGPASA